MCRVVVIAAVFGCLCITSAIGQTLDRRLFQSEAVYELHLANAAYRRCDANRDGAFQPDELACYDALPIKASYLPPPPIKPSTLLTGTAVEAAPKTAAARAKNEATPDLLAASNKAFLIVRRSRDAIGSFADPKPFANAAGAEFAYADDRIDDNQVWSARGIVAASFVHYGEVMRDRPYIDTMSLAPYVNFDRVSNSTKITSDVDNLTYGGVFEAGFANIFGATQYLDISGEVVTSFAGESKNWSVDLEWQPIGGRQPRRRQYHLFLSGHAAAVRPLFRRHRQSLASGRVCGGARRSQHATHFRPA